MHRPQGVPVHAKSPAAFPWLLALAAMSLLALPGPMARAAALHGGRWTAAEDLGKIAVHLALLPSPSPGSYHSKIILWNHGDEDHAAEFAGTVWNWSPTVQDACGSWPSSNFSAQSLNSPGFDIFCAVSQVTQGGDLWVVGGTEIGEAGTRQTGVFRASDNSWVSSGKMQYGRWYGGLAALPDGRAVVSSGSLYDQLWVYGGRRENGTTIGDLNRFGANLNGVWETAVAKTTGWPEERSGHAAAGELTIFGGRNASGTLKNDVWDMTVSNNETGSDYAYSWAQRTISGIEQPKLRQRTAAIADTSGNLWVIGGLGRDVASSADSVFSDVWSLRKEDGEWTWTKHTPSGGPGARYGHAAVFDTPRNRILLFGGAADSGAAATDATVHALSVGTTPAWSTPTLRGSAAPTARLGHAMVWDRVDRKRTKNPDVAEHHAVLFGGQSQEGSGYSNQVWHLWIAGNGDLEWKQGSPTGSAPSGRAWASGARNGSRFLFFGGDTLGGPARGQVFEFDVAEPNNGWDVTNGTWRTLATRSEGLNGASMVAFTNRPVFPRYAEIATPGDSTSWQTLSGPLLHEWYPAMWTWPTQSGSGYKVFFAGPSFQTGSPLRWTSYQLDVSSGTWSEFPSGGNSGIKGGASVLYRPGKVMKGGSRDTEGLGGIATAATRTIDLTAGTPAWSSSDDMKWGRVNHNFTLLPTGEVLATGGTGKLGNQVIVDARREPEIWNPEANSGAGDWYRGPGDSLTLSPLVKDYHSTAILLPDGRVLAAGGNADGPSRVRASIYCPPYLFKGDGTDALAPRPEIGSAPTAVTWGKTFTVCVTDTAGITRAALVAPGATTHGQDQNQRYIPLSFTRSPYGQKLYVTAPADSNVAPPGYYMLFLTGARAGGTHYPDAPGIARWIRVKRDLRDTCDTIRPAIQSDFGVDVVTSTAAYLAWTEHADDSVATASGRVSKFDVRKYHTAITSETVWNSAPDLAGEPQPTGAGSWHEWTLSSLTPCTDYFVAGRSHDDNNNLSLLHGSVSFTTLGQYCGPYLFAGPAGSSGMRVTGGADVGEAGARSRNSTDRRGSAASAQVGGGGHEALVVETIPGEPGWTVRVSRVTDVAGIAAADATAIVAQVPDGVGGWRTVNRITPPEGEDLAGLCALRDGGRYVLPAGYSIEQVATSFDGSGGTLTVGEVGHSSDGALAGAALADPSATELSPGETLTAEYAAGGAGEAEGSWYLLVRRAPAEKSVEQGGAGSAALLPARFALLQNAPNPFSATTKIGFELPRASRVKIELFDLLGRRLRTLTDRVWPAGRHGITWDRLTDRGERLSSGVLLYRMTADGFREQKKLVIGTK